MPPTAKPILDRLATKFVIAESGCWPWTDKLDPNGYGRIGINNTPHLAYRVVYEQTVGKVLAGLELDHLCRNRGCVNPDHLEPVTHRENMLRGAGFAARNAAVTHCPRGHEYDDRNTGTRRHRPGRYCRACARERMAETREARRAH